MKNHKKLNPISLLFLGILFFTSLPGQVLTGWDTGPLSGYGPSPFSPTVSETGVTAGGLTRGSGVTTPGAGQPQSWGGRGWNYPTAAAGITANAFVTFSVTVNSGFQANFSSIDPWEYRRNASGPPFGLVQYKLNSGSFTTITTVNFSGGVAGGNIPSIELSGISNLQNLPAGTVVTFRIVPYGASAANGFWFVFDRLNSSANDLAINGNVCNTSVYYADADGDAYGNPDNFILTCDAEPPTGYVTDNSDCNDDNGSVNPAAEEVCNLIDDNCNGETDEGFTSYTFYQDADNDNYGNPLITTEACMQPPGYAEDNTDCDDSPSGGSIHPGATEECNLIDDNCDGNIDESGTSMYTFYRDADADNFGNPSESIYVPDVCPPAGYVSDNTDCDDNNVTIHPYAEEVCNFTDDNCDGNIDEGFEHYTYYADNDNDGYGDANNTIESCSTAPPAGYVTNGDDCNDGDEFIHPDAEETCNSTDDNCDGTVDEGYATITYYRDWDGDGYGDEGNSVTLSECSTPPSGYVTDHTDCYDDDASRNPGASEVCNYIDDDCDWLVDEDSVCYYTYYRDFDGDGYGNPFEYIRSTSISPPDGYVYDSSDCDDTDPNIHPAAEELCDEIDNNCDGTIDENCRMYNSQKQSVNVHPNPASSEFTINATFADARKAEVFITLYNTRGEKVYFLQTEKQNSSITKTITLDDVASTGMYLIKISSGTENIYTQLMLQK